MPYFFLSFVHLNYLVQLSNLNVCLSELYHLLALVILTIVVLYGDCIIKKHIITSAV